MKRDVIKEVIVGREQMQMMVAMEELAELSQAISKYCRTVGFNGEELINDRILATDNILKEIADVEIMIEQVKLIISSNELTTLETLNNFIDFAKKVKLDRLEKRLDSGTLNSFKRE